MDFLDSLDLQALTHVKKSDRMRSWYMYEQYKTLEQHQLDAAQKLRNRSLQERLLQRELCERRARRALYDQVSFTKSEPKIDRSQATCLSTTADDFYESFCELHDFEANSLDSHHGSETYMDDFKTIDEFHEDTSCADSVVSSVVVDKGITNIDQRTMAENIKQHLQTVKKNMVSLERFARMADDISEDSIDSLGWPKPTNVLCKDVGDNQLFCVWSRLVAFAYHIIQLNHGNCYYDYSSQLLTAVLACDALRRGVNRMCDILQYYVSPIKFADSEDGSTVYKKSKKLSYVSKKKRKTSTYKINSSLHKKCSTKRYEENYNSGNLRDQHRKCLIINKMEENRRRHPKSRKRSRAERASVSRSLWPEELEYGSSHRGRVGNPMIQLVQYLDDILKADMEDCTNDFY